MEEEQYYLFVDKTGHCFDGFAATEDNTDYHIMIANLFVAGRKFSVEDMLCFCDDLTVAGFKWGIDFFVKKVDKDRDFDTIKA